MFLLLSRSVQPFAFMLHDRQHEFARLRLPARLRSRDEQKNSAMLYIFQFGLADRNIQILTAQSSSQWLMGQGSSQWLMGHILSFCMYRFGLVTVPLFTHMHTYTHTYTHTYIHTHVHTHTRTYTHARTHTHTHRAGETVWCCQQSSQRTAQ